jgi:hypothetical protein
MSASSLAQPALWMVTSLASKGKARQGTRMGRHGGSPFTQQRVAFDVSIVDPTAVSHSGTGACSESFLNPNAGARSGDYLIRREDENGQVQTPMPTAWYRLRTDDPHSEWRHGGAVPEAVLESTLE